MKTKTFFRFFLLGVMTLFTLGAWAQMPDKDYLCFTAEEAGAKIELIKNGEPDAVTLEYYCTSDEVPSWKTFTPNSTTVTLTKASEKVYFRNKGTTTTFSQSSSNYYQFALSGNVAASGNIMSLVDKNVESTTIPCDYCFYKLFYSCGNLTSAADLKLPAMTLKNYCYQNMFFQCTNLVTAPAELPATTLADNCYNFMFAVCKKISKAPNLPATTLNTGCYSGMFRNCEKLSYVKVGFTMWYNGSATDWLNGVASTGTFVCPEGLDVTTRSVNRVPAGWTVKKIEPMRDYLCFTAETEGATVELKKNKATTAVTLEYSTDNGTNWITVDFSVVTTTDKISLNNVGDKVYFRNKGTATSFSQSTSKYYRFVLSGNVAASGNVMSLVDKNCSTTDISADTYKYCFCYLFRDCESLTAAPELPATTLASYCYYGMFRGCTNLTAAPELPATTLASSCYYGMFSGCTNLTAAPELPATTLAPSCYYYMFSGCTNLTAAPELKATTLASTCYSAMFNGCKKLTEAPALPATELAQNCYDSMFAGCEALTTAPKLPATTLTQSCYYSMFKGCESLATAPELPATTLAQSCYSAMFYGCKKLTEAPALPATTLAQSCYNSMFAGCEALTTAPALPATTLAQCCYSNMFNGCINLTTVELPATSFETISRPDGGYYYQMFNGCEKLNSVKVAFTEWPIKHTNGWLEGVAETGTFVCPAELNVTTRDADHVPAGWTIEHPDYLCITAEEAGATVQLMKDGSPTAVTIQYSTDEGATWTTVDYSSATTTGDITLTNVGDKVYFRNAKEAKDVTGFSTDWNTYHYFTFSANVSVSGNIMSLVDKNVETTTIPCDYCFYYLFNECETLTNAADLKLPATELKPYCYANMFYFCSSLKTAPAELPATILAENCYESMFETCSSLETAPTLPAEELAEGCCIRMFSECQALKTAPELPATILAESCYENMFFSCESLKTAPELPAEELAEGCYISMFEGCIELTTAELPAEELAEGCYSSMFSDCYSLEYLKVGFKEWHYDDLWATEGWLGGAAEDITFVCPIELDTETTRDESHVPAGCTVKKFADEFTFDDATPHTATNDIEYESLTYKRTFAAEGQYEALYLPFSMTMTSDLSDKVTIAKIYMVSTKGSVVGGAQDAGVDVVVVKTLGEGESTKPHTPYFIRSKAGTDLEFTQDNTTVYAATGVLPPQGYITCATTMDYYDFIGSYVVSSLFPEGDVSLYVLQNGGLHKVTAEAELPCNRWKMVKTPTEWNDNYDAPLAKAKMQIVTLGEDETTGIIGLDARMNADSTNDAIYTPAGVAVRKQQLTPGLYIQHGKKFIVK